MSLSLQQQTSVMSMLEESWIEIMCRVTYTRLWISKNIGDLLWRKRDVDSSPVSDFLWLSCWIFVMISDGFTNTASFVPFMVSSSDYD
jgi:hypothetical protein